MDINIAYWAMCAEVLPSHLASHLLIFHSKYVFSHFQNFSVLYKNSRIFIVRHCQRYIFVLFTPTSFC